MVYLKKHYARFDNQDDYLRTLEEECAASDKDGWQIDMPDGDEIDDIEEASVDDDSQCPRMRTKFSCWKVIFKEILRYIFYVKVLKSNS